MRTDTNHGVLQIWLPGEDLNLRFPAYEAGEMAASLPGFKKEGETSQCRLGYLSLQDGCPHIRNEIATPVYREYWILLRW